MGGDCGGVDEPFPDLPGSDKGGMEMGRGGRGGGGNLGENGYLLSGVDDDFELVKGKNNRRNAP